MTHYLWLSMFLVRKLLMILLRMWLLYVISHLSLAVFKILSSYLSFPNLITVCLGLNLFEVIQHEVHWIFECSLGGRMLKLKLQYFGHQMQRANSFEKTLMLGKIKDKRSGWQEEIVGWPHRINGHESEETRRQWRTGKSGVLQSMRSQNQTWLGDGRATTYE